jgi:arsenate reductase
MAEGFARAYGTGLVEAASAGLYPAGSVARLSREAMLEKGIDLAGIVPRRLADANPTSFDLIVNMSGERLPGFWLPEVIDWSIPDPVLGPIEEYRQSRDLIEVKVRELLAEIRKRSGP